MPTPARTTLPQIVSAGCAVLEAEGPAGLTMQAVAARVGVRAPSLYKHVRDRDALLSLVAAATLEELTRRLTQADSSVAGLARAYRAFGQDRPEGFRLILSSGADPESLARASAPVVRLAADLVGRDEALEAARLLTAWATGFITMELAGAFRLDGDRETAFEFGLRRLALALTPQPSD